MFRAAKLQPTQKNLKTASSVLRFFILHLLATTSSGLFYNVRTKYTSSQKPFSPL